MALHTRNFYTSRLLAEKRIGPHNKDVISTIVGNLLGDGFAEKRNNATRFHLHISNKNAQYIFTLHSFFAKNGYCNCDKPKVKKNIKKNNVVYFSIRFTTFSFSSLNYVYDSFYEKQNCCLNRVLCTEFCVAKKSFYKKKVSKNIYDLLTEKAFAILFMDHAENGGEKIQISTESFSFKDNVILQKAIYEKFNLECTIQKHKYNFLLYFEKKHKEKLFSIIKPYMYSCMYYKLK